ncbi:dipeptide ABC transporter ATP-binding protein [Brevibacterium sp. UCMA 11754]|uniref:dipeptide ABC transporter ATP-binding protein n=1 Tax=Brevibacterium sp. UCMA 11754 TaxID=2749198 RepID=UPI001F432A22|nr:ABC transporter ATP-binding protein [Brevibacterium sp. UCMA 11754]MCF2573413.1 ABC transporter ATP-binding protein [Brevibacterium sp. UCMA 11754]
MTLTDFLAWPASGAGTELLDKPGADKTGFDQPNSPIATPAHTSTPTPAHTSTPTSVLEVSGLSVTYPRAATSAISDVSLSIAPGGTVAIVGESGSGKSTTAAALTGLLPAGTAVHAATHSHLGEDLVGAKPRTWQRILGTGIAYVPQDAGAGLNPVRTIASGLAETLTVNGYARPRIGSRVAEVLDAVGLDTAEHGRRYPHELSGGQRQRVLIANAIAADPALIIADEPTSALDATVQKQVLDVLSELVAGSSTALLLITHDLGVAKERAEDLIVMRSGRIVEAGRTRSIIASPSREYTRALLTAAPNLGGGRLRPSADSAPGRSPTDGASTVGASADQSPTEVTATDAEVVLRATDIARDFGGPHPAVKRLGVELTAGRTVGIVGESGSGKTTTARILLGAERPDAGTIELHDRELSTYGAKGLGRRIRYVHQDSSAALDPNYTVEKILTEPLRGHRIGTRRDRPVRVRDLLGFVALDESLLGRTPRELSGGQRQRLAIARAIAVEPEVLILDEPVSALDVQVQSQILQLLVDLQQRLGLAYLFISHDLAVIEQIADQVLVMKDGLVVESGDTAMVLRESGHPYTRTLLDAVPRFDSTAVTRPATRPATSTGVDHA